MGKRVSFTVEVNLDAIHGWGDNPEDFRRHIERCLMDTIPHYNPVVTHTPEEEAAVDREPLTVDPALLDEPITRKALRRHA
jgi:hypothetical protein